MRLLTVVIPAYNSQDYLARALDSVLVAKDEVEIIVVNDGSQDCTSQIADSYAALYPETVKAVHQANGGHGSAVNSGLALATCPYFKVLDSDDYFAKEAFSALIATLRTLSKNTDTPVDLIFTDYTMEILLKQHESKIGTFSAAELYPRQRDKKFFYIDNTLKAVLPAQRIFNWQEAKCWSFRHLLIMHSLCYRTALLKAINLHLPEKVYYEDNYYSLIPLQYVQKMYYLPVCLYIYYLGRPDQSVSLQKIVQNYRHQVKVTEALLQDLHYESNYAALPLALKDLIIKHMARLYEVCQVIQLLEPSPAHYTALLSLQAEFTHKEPRLWQAVSKKCLVRFLNFAIKHLHIVSKSLIKIIRKLGLLKF